jgi:hypothetical protein
MSHGFFNRMILTTSNQPRYASNANAQGSWSRKLPYQDFRIYFSDRWGRIHGPGLWERSRDTRIHHAMPFPLHKFHPNLTILISINLSFGGYLWWMHDTSIIVLWMGEHEILRVSDGLGQIVILIIRWKWSKTIEALEPCFRHLTGFRMLASFICCRKPFAAMISNTGVDQPLIFCCNLWCLYNDETVT